MARKLDGRLESQRLFRDLKWKIAQRRRPITLATILVGQRFDSALYVKLKRKAAAEIGIKSRAYELPKNVLHHRLEKLIEKLNQTPSIHGILLQLPLPAHLNPDAIIAKIDPRKDVDGFHPLNRRVVPPPVQAVLHLAKLAKPRRRATFAILAKTSVFSKRLVVQLKAKGFKATVANAVRRVPPVTRRADVVITALGRGPMLQAAHIKRGAIVIDVGTRRPGKNLPKSVYGDVARSVWAKAKAVTPVPGGVGPMTIYFLLKNTYQLAKRV